MKTYTCSVVGDTGALSAEAIVIAADERRACELARRELLRVDGGAPAGLRDDACQVHVGAAPAGLGR